MNLFSSAFRYALVLAISPVLLHFDLPEPAMVSLVVYDVLGREVARLVDKELSAGWHQARFDAGNLPSGVYLYRIRAGDFHDTGRMLLLK